MDALHDGAPRSLASPLLPAGWLRPEVKLKGQLDEPWAVGKPAAWALNGALVSVTARLLADGTLVPAGPPPATAAAAAAASAGAAGAAAAGAGGDGARAGGPGGAAARAAAASAAAVTHAIEYTAEGHVRLRWRVDLLAKPPLGLAGPALPLTVEGTSLFLLDASALPPAPSNGVAASAAAAAPAAGDPDAPTALVAEHRLLEVAVNGQPSLAQVADWAKQWSQGARPSPAALAAAPLQLFEWLTRQGR
jgi:hypothetical protein